MKPFDKSLLPV